MRMTKVAGIIQARMSSTRLPGKVLMEVNGKTMLGYLVERVNRAKSLDEVIVTTSTNPENDAIHSECSQLGIGCFRIDGEDDVLNRYLQATRWIKADVSVRITGDSVLMDPLVIDYVMKQYLAGNYDCATSYTTQSFPKGFSLSVFSAESLDTVNDLELDANDREHVILAYLRYRNQFNILEVDAPQHWRAYPLSLALDTPEDYLLISEIIQGLSKRGEDFGLDDILSFIRRNKHLTQASPK